MNYSRKISFKDIKDGIVKCEDTCMIPLLGTSDSSSKLAYVKDAQVSYACPYIRSSSGHIQGISGNGSLGEMPPPTQLA